MKTNFYIIAIVLVGNSLSLCQTNAINNFDEILSKLIEGKKIHVIIHYVKCKLVIDDKEEKSPDVIGGMELMPFEYFTKNSINNNKAYIASSNTIFVFHSRYGYIFNYIKIRIYEDNSVYLNARYIDAKTYETKMDEYFYSQINNGYNDGGFLFILNKE
jgi:hypothetical protein